MAMAVPGLHPAAALEIALPAAERRRGGHRSVRPRSGFRKRASRGARSAKNARLIFFFFGLMMKSLAHLEEEVVWIFGANFKVCAKNEGRAFVQEALLVQESIG